MQQNRIEKNTTYARALKRADAAGYVVTAIATSKENGAVLGCVVTNNEGTKHTLTVHGNSFACDAKCKGAKNGNYCMHRACATRKMIERATEKVAQAALDAQQEADRIAHEVLTGRDIFAEPIILRNTPPMSIYRQ